MWAVGNQMMVEDHHREISVAPAPPVTEGERRGIQQKLEQESPGRPPKTLIVTFAPRRQLLFHLEQVLRRRTAKQFAGAALRSCRHCSIREVADRSHDDVGAHYVGLQRQALQIVERLARGQCRTNYTSDSYLPLHLMNCQHPI